MVKDPDLHWPNKDALFFSDSVTPRPSSYEEAIDIASRAGYALIVSFGGAGYALPGRAEPVTPAELVQRLQGHVTDPTVMHHGLLRFTMSTDSGMTSLTVSPPYSSKNGSVDARDAGTLCGGCGTRYRGDVTVDDAVWDAIKPAHSDLLCANCIAERATRSGLASALRLTLK